MSVVGIDFGTQSTRIAVVRTGGVDVICNEVSDRATPSMVSFDAKRRYAGDASRTQMMGNLRNTVCNLPRLLGRKCNDPLIQNVEMSYLCCSAASDLKPEDDFAVGVNYRNETRQFGTVELAGMFMNKVKSIVHAETKAAVSDVVISVPAFFTEIQRRAVVDAAEVAGLKCLRTINDTTAAAINYGITKTDLSADVPRAVVIVDVGYASTKACLAHFYAGRVQIIGHVWDANLGGRDFDEVLVQQFARDILAKTKSDVTTSSKAMMRLRVAAERMKKILSGIASTRMELDCLIDDRDCALEASRETLEANGAHLLERLEQTLTPLLSLAPQVPIDSVEIIGGVTRVPAIKALLARMFGVAQVSTTLNADEAVARGSALQCAMESPLIRVRQFVVEDVNCHPLVLSWTATSDLSVSVGNDKSNVLVPVGARLGEPATLLIPPALVLPLTLTVSSNDDTAAVIASYTISATKKVEGLMTAGGNQQQWKLGVKAMIDHGGIVRVPEASAETEVVENVVEPAAAASTEEGNAEQSAASPVSSTRTVVRTYPLTVKCVLSSSVDRKLMQRLKEAEVEMAINDDLVARTDDSRNALEESIYNLRAKLEDEECLMHSEEAERDAVSKELLAAEDWLYGDGADVTIEEYELKRGDLLALIAPIQGRIAKTHAEKKAAADAEAAAAAAASSTSTPSTASEVPTMDMD